MGKLCVFCGEPAKGQGEHVWPQWFLQRWKGRGDFFHESTGAPSSLTSKGRPNLARVTLPVCGVDSPNDCNRWLNETFEKPVMPYLAAILDDQQPVLDVGVDPVARWAIKTLLLYSHPLARNGDRLPKGRPWELPADLLPAWRRSGQLPDDLSLWMVIVDPNVVPTVVPAFEKIMLPRVTRADGAGGIGASRIMGFGMKTPNGPRLVFQLAFHPLTDFEHPLEAAGLVTRLWPGPPPRLDLGAMQAIDPAAETQWGRAITHGGFTVQLPAGERWSKATMDKYQ